MRTWLNINLKILIALMLFSSCTNSQESLTDSSFERERKILVANGITKTTVYLIENGKRTYKRSEIQYNENGYVIKMSFYSDKELLTKLVVYKYDSENNLIETLEGKDENNLEKVFSRIENKTENTITEYEYDALKGVTYKSFYQNDSLGRNVYKEYYHGLKLVSTYSFEYDDNGNLLKILGKDSEGNSSGKMIYRYKNNQPVNIKKYDYGKLFQEENFSYNSEGETIQYEINFPEDYKHIIENEYKNGLIKYQTTSYISLTDDYTDITKTEWVYE